MKPIQTLLLYEPINAKNYLDQLLKHYPYDIIPSLVYTLLDEQPYPHPSLLTFIDYIRQISCYLVTTSDRIENNLYPLFTVMCQLSQRNGSVLHTHQFQFDCFFHITRYPLFHPYAYLPLDQVDFIDHISIRQTNELPFPISYPNPSIQYTEAFSLGNITFDPKAYFALSVKIATANGLIFLPRRYASLIPAISTLYEMTVPSTHPDFILCYGIQASENKNIISYDNATTCTIGCSMKASPYSYSLKECMHMITSIYSTMNLRKQDLTLSSAMIQIHKHTHAYNILLCAKHSMGISALVDSLIRVCDSRNITHKNLFENYGTLHLLDDTIYASGIQIGAAIPIQALSKARSFAHLFASILVKEGQKISYVLTPFTNYETTCKFHPVHMICYLDENQSGSLSRFDSLDDALQKIPMELLCFDDSQAIKVQHLWETCLNTVFLKAIPLYHIPIKQNHSFDKKWMTLAKQIWNLVPFD